jgi:hypothetical protein
MTKLFYCVVFFIMSSAVVASEWTLEQMNRVIDQTNFVVNRGCSGTLISIEERLILTNHHCIDQNISFVEREEIVNLAECVARRKKQRREKND